MIKNDLSVPAFSTIPQNNRHAVSVSLPKLNDVKGYEEGCLQTLSHICGKGYHRFSKNVFNIELEKYLKEKHSIEGDIFLVNDENALNFFQIQFKDKVFSLLNDQGITIIHNVEHFKNEVKKFFQHTGVGISSRRAEGILYDKMLGCIQDGERSIKNTLGTLYGTQENDVYLSSTGMSAVYSLFHTVNGIEELTGKHSWCQLGWLYLDTGEILSKYSVNSLFISDVNDLEKLEQGLISGTIKSVITEVPTNPLILVPHLEKLSELCKKYKIPLILDTSLGTGVNLDVLKYADVVVESLTKFASGSGDVMMGATILNENSCFYDELKEKLESHRVKPDASSLQRVSECIGGYEERMKKISQNTLALVEKLQNLNGISKIHWPYSEISKENYERIEKYPGAVGGVVSLEFQGDFEKIYNRLALPKGPSFGMEQTLAMPYVYLAHYDLIQTKEGREHLQKNGINHDLLRLSVGLENSDEIYEIIKDALE